MSHHSCSQRDEAFDLFYERWQENDLVVNKWFALQSASNHPAVLENLEALVKHEKFNILNPNRIYSSLRQFIKSNPVGFHHPSEGLRVNRKSYLDDRSKKSTGSSYSVEIVQRLGKASR